MCTLSYIPNDKGGFILTSNRDEQVLRESALHPIIYAKHNPQLMYPKDPKGGGTWLATSSNKFTVCLLNGAFDRHVPNPPYRQSRGLVVLDFFAYSDVDLFVKGYSFANIEPFTLIIFNHHSIVHVHELRWDGNTVFFKKIDGLKPQIWSSATLYDTTVIAARKKWFDDFLTENPEPTLHDMLHFHHFGGVGDNTINLLMNRNNILRTVSVTAIKIYENGAFMLYEDVIKDTCSVCNLPYSVAKDDC